MSSKRVGEVKKATDIIEDLPNPVPPIVHRCSPASSWSRVDRVTLPENRKRYCASDRRRRSINGTQSPDLGLSFS